MNISCSIDRDTHKIVIKTPTARYERSDPDTAMDLIGELMVEMIVTEVTQ